jgi:invasion protein IalB
VVTCREFAEGRKKRICTAQLQVKQSGTNNVLFAWTIGHDDDNRAMSVLQTPTGVSIPAGVDFRLGKAAARKVPFATCESGRCTATLPVDANLVRDASAAADAEVVIHAPNGAGVQFSFPLKGFAKAYAELNR